MTFFDQFIVAEIIRAYGQLTKKSMPMGYLQEVEQMSTEELMREAGAANAALQLKMQNQAYKISKSIAKAGKKRLKKEKRLAQDEASME